MVIVQKIHEELNFLKQMLRNLGFFLVGSTTKSIEDILHEEFIEEIFGVYMGNNNNNDRVGSCTIINAFNGTIIEITLNLNALTIHNAKVKQLLLLGFKEHIRDDLNYNWLEYRVEIK